MSNQLIPIIEKVNEEFVVNSRVLAEQLEKRHDNVVRDLEKILETSDVSSLIKSSTYEVPGQTRKYKQYLLTEDGFTLYIFNIQGYQEFKLAYIHEFRRLREMSLNPLTMLLSCSKEQLALTALKLTETVQTQNQLILEQKPKVEVYEQISDSTTLHSFKEVADLLNIKGLGRNNLISLLKSRGILTKTGEAMRTYIDRKYFEEKLGTFKINGSSCSATTTKVTGKGLIWLTKMLKQN